MPFHVGCPVCNKALRVPTALAGRTVKWPACGVTMAVPPLVPEAAAVPEKDYQPTDLPPVVRVRANRSRRPAAEPPGERQSDQSSRRREDRRDEKDNEYRPGTKFCHECGHRIRSRAEICPECGVRQMVRDGQGSSRAKRDGIQVCLLVSAISNILVGLLWASTCFGIVFTVPMVILCVFEFMLYAKADRLSLERFGREAKSLSLFMVIVGIFNTAALVCGIIVMVKSPRLYVDQDEYDDDWDE